MSNESRVGPRGSGCGCEKPAAERLVDKVRERYGRIAEGPRGGCCGDSPQCCGEPAGDDIAQAMALIGAKPVWDHASRRVTGYEIITLAELGRPRVDVTLRISGFFRDAFPVQIALFDRAIRAVGGLEESERENPIAARMTDDHRQFLDRTTPCNGPPSSRNLWPARFDRCSRRAQ